MVIKKNKQKWKKKTTIKFKLIYFKVKNNMVLKQNKKKTKIWSNKNIEFNFI